MLDLILPKPPQSEAARLEGVNARKNEIANIESKLAAIYPLTSEHVPPGTYHIFARDEGVDIPLIDLQISQSPK